MKLTNHLRGVLLAVLDGTCFVAMSGTLMDLGDMGLLKFDSSRRIPWRVTPTGLEELAIGEVSEEI